MPMFSISEAGANIIQTLSNVALILGSVLAMAGTIGAFWSQGLLSRYATARQTQSDLKIEEAKRDAARANEGLAESNERAAALEKDAATARLELEQIKERQRWRTITNDQRQRFIALMEPLAKGKIEMRFTAGNNESNQFSSMLARMFADSGCEIIEPTLAFISTGPSPVFGITLQIKDKDTPPPHATSLQKSLEQIGISAPAGIEAKDTPLAADTVRIYVYSKSELPR